ncbi:hypothetical protein WJ59_00510 [Burkholderia gladioli]|nr:hypothetical protein EDD84_27575 [Burkholderia gladioli]KVM72680.1 hypothetical protein WJ59_00510 [Burkholderia gladioli]
MRYRPAWTWLALLGAPSATLTMLVIAYGLAVPSCGWHSGAPVAASAAVTAGLAAALAWRAWQGGLAAGHERAPRRARAMFLARVGAASSALSAFALLGFAIAAWIVPPCAA